MDKSRTNAGYGFRSGQDHEIKNCWKKTAAPLKHYRACDVVMSNEWLQFYVRKLPAHCRHQWQLQHHTTTIRTTLSRTHTSAKATDVAKLSLSNKRQITQSSRAKYGGVPPNRNLNQNPNVMWSGLSSKSVGFFRGPRANFPPNFLKIGWVVFA